MRITREQIAAGVTDDRAFASWYCEEVMRPHLPQTYHRLSEEGRREMTLVGRSYARHLGFTRSEDQASFITLMWLIGANFFQQPGFQEIFADDRITPAEKIDACHGVSREIGVAAIRNADELYWYPHMVARRDEMTA